MDPCWSIGPEYIVAVIIINRGNTGHPCRVPSLPPTTGLEQVPWCKPLLHCDIGSPADLTITLAYLADGLAYCWPDLRSTIVPTCVDMELRFMTKPRWACPTGHLWQAWMIRCWWSQPATGQLVALEHPTPLLCGAGTCGWALLHGLTWVFTCCGFESLEGGEDALWWP